MDAAHWQRELLKATTAAGRRHDAASAAAAAAMSAAEAARIAAYKARDDRTKAALEAAEALKAAEAARLAALKEAASVEAKKKKDRFVDGELFKAPVDEKFLGTQSTNMNQLIFVDCRPSAKSRTAFIEIPGFKTLKEFVRARHQDPKALEGYTIVWARDRGRKLTATHTKAAPNFAVFH